MHVLERFGWLAHCTPGFRAFMLANMRELRFAAGETMTHAGDHAGGAFGLIEGQTAFVTTIGNAAVGISQTGFAGAWWGQGPLLGMPRVGIASARTACRVGFVPLPLMKTHLAAEPVHWRDIALGYTDHVHIMAGAQAD